MIYNEIKQDLFSVDMDKYYLVHCISSDCKMGAGIAVEFEKRFKLRDELLKHKLGLRYYPSCIPINNVFNLITKDKYWDKPTYESLKDSLNIMKIICDRQKIKYLAMPRIGSGLDKLIWTKVKEIIKEIFEHTNIEILVCYKK